MSWIDCRKEFLTMFKIASNVQNLLQHDMPLRKVELTSNYQHFGNVAIKRGIFQWDSLLPLLFIIGLIPLTLILRKRKEALEFSNSKEWINHLLYMEDLKLYWKTIKGLDSLIQTVRILSSDICIELGIEKCNILVSKRGIKDGNSDIMLPNDLKISSLK